MGAGEYTFACSHFLPAANISQINRSEKTIVMKTLLITVLFILLSLCLYSQDTTLPSGGSVIHLRSGKVIKNARLWKISAVKVEYVKNGNLADVPTSDVKIIESKDCFFEFNEDMRSVKRMYDLILPYYGDTIRCVIEKTEKYQILYLEIVSKKERSILRESVKEYVQWPVKEIGEEKPESAVRPLRDTILHSIVNDTAGVQDTIVKAVPVSNALVVNDVPDEKRMKLDQSSNDISSRAYYHQSYERGVKDASHRYISGWGVGSFFLGMVYGAPYVSSAAANSNEENMFVPPGVDEKLYKEGFRNTLTSRKVKSATTGAAIAKGVVTFIFLLIVL